MRRKIGRLKEVIHKWKRWLVILAAVVAIGYVSLVMVFSFLTKYVAEQYGEQLIGRRINMAWAYVNPFTGYVHLDRLKVYEYKSDSVFVSFDGLTVNFGMLKLLKSEMAISSVKLDHPMVKIIQHNKKLNFADIQHKFARKKPPKADKKPFHFSILNVKIRGGHLYYIDRDMPLDVSIKELSVDSPDGFVWNRDYFVAHTSFVSERGDGVIEGTYAMNVKTLFYMMDVEVKHFDMTVAEQFMRITSKYGSLRGLLDADLQVNGNFRKAENINIKGRLAVSDLHLGKYPKDDYLAIEKMVLKMKDVNTERQVFLIDSVLLKRMYLKFEVYDDGDNFHMMFGNLVDTIIKKGIKMARIFFKSNYELHHLALINANIKFNDYTLSEKFAIEIDPLNIRADSVNMNHYRANVHLDAAVKPYGDIKLFLSTNPKGTGDFDLTYQIKNLPLAMFNAYTITYTSYPFDFGSIEANGTWSLRKSTITSQNHVNIINSRIAFRIKNKAVSWLPMRLILGLFRKPVNVMDYEIPISGDLNNPNFILTRAIIEMVKEIFSKAPAKTYLIEVKKLQAEIEKSVTLQWDMRQSLTTEDQVKFIRKIAVFLKKNPEASITVYPKTYLVKEKEQILFYEAKKKYFLATNHKTALAPGDVETIEKMSVKDSLFKHYVKKHAGGSMIFTLYDRCKRIISEATVNAGFESLKRERHKAFMTYFTDRGVEKRVKFAKNENVVPFNGFSFYMIEYKGKLPDFLVEAKGEMQDFKKGKKR